MDWESLHKLSTQSLDEAAMTRLTAQINQMDAVDIDSPSKGKTIFTVMKALLQQQVVRFEIALEEHEKLFEQEVASFAKREQRLLMEIEERDVARSGENENYRLSRNSSSGDKALLRENERLQLELTEIREKLSLEKTGYEKQQRMFESSEKEKWTLRHEVANLKEEVHHYQLQLESHHESSQDDQQSAFVVQVLKDKNQQIQQLLQHVQSLEKTNDILHERVDEVKNELKDSAIEMNETTVKCTRLQDLLQDSYTLASNLEIDKQDLNERLQQIAEENERLHQNEEEIFHFFNNRLEVVKGLLEQKQKELMHMNSLLVQRMKNKTEESYEHQQLADLSQVIKEKDEYIKLLETDRLGNDKMPSSSVANTTTEVSRSCTVCKHKSVEIEELGEQLKQLSDEMLQTKNLLLMSEKHARQKDKEFTEVYARMKEYEQGEYGLSEAVAEIKKFRSQLELRDRQIEKLISYVNVKEDADRNEGSSVLVQSQDAKQNLLHSEKDGLANGGDSKGRFLSADAKWQGNVLHKNGKAYVSGNEAGATRTSGYISRTVLISKFTQTDKALFAVS